MYFEVDFMFKNKSLFIPAATFAVMLFNKITWPIGTICIDSHLNNPRNLKYANQKLKLDA